jgi:hypothetical protein
MVERARLWFKQNTLLFFFVASSIVGVVLFAIPFTRDFGINFVTEIIGVWITVFLINRILERRERERRVVIDLRILRETSSIIASHFSIWKHLAWKYAPQAKIKTEADLKALYPTLIQLTRLDEQFDVVSIHDPESWKLFFHNRTIKQCFENYHKSILEDISSVMNNFKAHIEPELLGYFLELTEDRYFRDVASLSQSDVYSVVLNDFGEDENRLTSYLSEDTSHFAKINALKNYCEKLRVRIAEFTDVPSNTYEISRYFVNPVTHHQVMPETIRVSSKPRQD